VICSSVVVHVLFSVISSCIVHVAVAHVELMLALNQEKSEN
jgi:hypothetical protein